MMKREVLALVFEFLITMVVLIGSGLLLFYGKATEMAVSAISIVLTFWFTNRRQDKQNAQAAQAAQAGTTDPADPSERDPQ